jgi:effector-binding domain-containing protein
MNTPEVIYKDLEALQIAFIKTVIEKRADLWSLFMPLRETCGNAICGPAMAIFHYGAVKDGLLVEAAFPVSRPVESSTVQTRQLEAAPAWTLRHMGPHDTIRETTSKLLAHIREHAGTVGGNVREIYVTRDAKHLEADVTEIQVLNHEWDRRLAEGVEAVLGAAARQQVMAGIEVLTPESSDAQYREWICGAMDRLDALTDDPERQYRIMSCCAHVFPEERIAHLRDIYTQRHDIDDVLREMYQDHAWYEKPIRKGNALHMVKVPYDPEGYAQGATAVERRRAYCHCGFVRPYLDEVPAKLSPTFCWCGAGWYRRLWEGILGQPIKVEHVETLLKGNDRCTLVITLPLALEGELSPEM